MKTILIVDDEYDIVSTLQMVFSLEGYEALLAYDGDEALALLKNKPLPDLILCDLMMPGMDGYRFITALRSHPEYNRVPLIIASASHLDYNRLKKGDWEYFILKPFDLKRLMSTIEKTITDGRSPS